MSDILTMDNCELNKYKLDELESQVDGHREILFGSGMKENTGLITRTVVLEEGILAIKHSLSKTEKWLMAGVGSVLLLVLESAFKYIFHIT